MRAIDLASVPTWLLWIFAAAGYAFLLAVLGRMMPPTLRSAWAKRIVFVTVVAFGPLAFAHDPRWVLWFCAVGFAADALPLLWMGKVPADMPSAKNPECRHHPEYPRVARRGRIAGVVIVGVTISIVTLTAVSVRGL